VTRSAVFLLIRGCFEMTRDTVEGDTPALLATSLMVTDMVVFPPCNRYHTNVRYNSTGNQL